MMLEHSYILLHKIRGLLLIGAVLFKKEIYKGGKWSIMDIYQIIGRYVEQMFALNMFLLIIMW